MRRLGPLLGWSATLVAVVAGMVVAGRGNLAAPPARPGAWASWAASVGPPAAAVAVVRLVVLALALYLLVATAVAVAAEVARHALLVELSELLSVPFIRRAVHTAVGASLVGATVAGGVASVSSAAPPARAAGRRDPVPALHVVRRSPMGPPTTEASPAPDLVPVAIPAAPPPPPAAPPAVVQPPWTVAPGDHFWSIARRVLVAGWHREPSEQEVTAYWRDLIEANRQRLPDPQNADLLFPGDELLVPGLPSGPT